MLQFEKRTEKIMPSMRGNDSRLLTDGYVRSLSVTGRGRFEFKAGEGKLITHTRGAIETGRLAFEDGQELWAVFVNTNDGFDVYCFVPQQIENDLVRFDMDRGLMGKEAWTAGKCRYRLDGRPLHMRSANDVDPSGWSLRTLAADARPYGQMVREVDVTGFVDSLQAEMGDSPEDRRELARRLRAASENLLRQADLLEA